MAGFETRAIWGSDPGLVSDRFRYTGVNVPPLDEAAIKRIQENAKQFAQVPLPLGRFAQVPLPSPSEIIAVQDLNRLKAFEDAINKQQQQQRQSLGRFNPKEETNWRHPLFSLNTNQIDLNQSNPFNPGLKAAEQEWFRRLDAGIPEASAFDQMADFRERALDWEAIKGGAIPPGRIGGIKPQTRNPFSSTGLQPGDVFDDMQTDKIEALLNKPKVIPGQKNNPNAFKQLLNAVNKELKGAGAGVKELGRIAADVVLPNRNKVPDYMLDVVETPEFVEAKKQFGLWGSVPTESIAPGVISEKQSRWLIDPRRTPVVGTGMFGAVTVPARSGKAFKVQEGQAKSFLENEVNMALRTAELGLGPQIHSATFQPLGKPASPNAFVPPDVNPSTGSTEAYRAIVRTEAIPHRKFEELSPQEKEFLQLEKFKLNEGLYRGGIENQDDHFGNILLNDATKKAVQVDSGLARTYDAFDESQLQNRLRNIVVGLNTAGLKDVAKDTSEIGNALIDEAWKSKTPEMYAEVENFFNRSGNILMKQSKPLTNPTPPSVKNNKIPLAKTGLASIGADALIGYALGQPADQALADAVTAPISADALGGRPLASIERLGPKGEFVDTKSNTVLSPQGRYTNTGIAYKGGKPVIVPRGSVAGEGNFRTQAKAILGNALNTWRQRLGALGIFGR